LSKSIEDLLSSYSRAPFAAILAGIPMMKASSPAQSPARADLVVSGDQDLLILKSYRRIRIVNAVEALAIITAR